MNPVIKLSDRPSGGYWEIPVLALDDSLLVLDKPAGLRLKRDPDEPAAPALLPLLHAAIAAAKPWAAQLGLQHVAAVHRPEPDTSGVLLLARSPEWTVALAGQFASNRGHSRHLALVRGEPREDTFELDTRLVPHPDRPGEMRSDPRRGRRYHTRCEVMERFRHYTLLRCHATPGRPGQIAAHLRQARLPLVADRDRGGAGLFLSQLKRDYVPKRGQEERPLIGRPTLHLERVEVQHPASGETVTFEAPLPRDFIVALKYLRRFAA